MSWVCGVRALLPDDWPLLAGTEDFETAQAVLDAAGLGDGLPLVPPTEPRLAAMLNGVAAPGQSLGLMPPLFGDLTVAAVAYCCVLAGCRRAELPVVLTAAAACLEPEFNLLGLMTTTGSAAVATLVHGPVVDQLAMNASINCLGPGNRANACIGRAVSLVLRNIGGARAGSGDMATAGQPGKYAFCFAEGNDGGDFPRLHVRRGFAADASAVTVLGVSGTAEVLPVDGRDTPQAILEPVAVSMRTAFLVNGAAKQPEPPEQVFILPPELASQLTGNGWDLARICGYLFEATKIDGRPITISAETILPIVTGGPGVKMVHLPLWGGGSRSVSNALIRV